MKEQIKFCVWSVGEKGFTYLYTMEIPRGKLSLVSVKRVLNISKED